MPVGAAAVPAVAVERAKALDGEVLKIVNCFNVGFIQSAARAFRQAFLSRVCWEMPPNREPWKLL